LRTKPRNEGQIQRIFVILDYSYSAGHIQEPKW